METRWESSKKSLFVKTVWADGHHHVILYKNDPLACLVTPHASSRVNSGLSQKSGNSNTKKVPKNMNFPNLKVSSVKLLLDGINGMKTFKNENKILCEYHKKPKRAKSVTINVLPENNVKLHNICADDVFTTQIKANFMNSLKDIKAASVDISDKSQNLFYEDLLTSKCTYEENRLSTLSERVLVWLDLAIQNGDYQNETLIKKNDNNNNDKKRVITAHNCTKFTPENPFKDIHSEAVTRTTLNNNKGDQINSNSSSPRSDSSILKTRALRSPAGKNKVQISSRLEKVKKAATPKAVGLKTRHDTFKRQLHIFIPDLPKRSSDMESNLSSKLSSNFSSKLSNLSNSLLRVKL